MGWFFLIIINKDSAFPAMPATLATFFGTLNQWDGLLSKSSVGSLSDIYPLPVTLLFGLIGCKEAQLTWAQEMPIYVWGEAVLRYEWAKPFSLFLCLSTGHTVLKAFICVWWGFQVPKAPNPPTPVKKNQGTPLFSFLFLFSFLNFSSSGIGDPSWNKDM